MRNESGFIAATLAQPEDETARLVYANWLEERSDPRGEFLRLELVLPRLTRTAEYPALEARRDELQDQIDTRWLYLIGVLVPGRRIRGRVAHVTEVEVRVDLGVFVGVLHVTDMPWSRFPILRKVFPVGSSLEGVILEVDCTQGRIQLGHQGQRNPPWDDIWKRFPVGTAVRGHVTGRVPAEEDTPDLLWVDIQPGVWGFLRLPETRQPAVGDSVSAIVAEIDYAQRELLLELSGGEPDAADGGRADGFSGFRASDLSLAGIEKVKKP